MPLSSPSPSWSAAPLSASCRICCCAACLFPSLPCASHPSCQCHRLATAVPKTLAVKIWENKEQEICNQKNTLFAHHVPSYGMIWKHCHSINLARRLLIQFYITAQRGSFSSVEKSSFWVSLDKQPLHMACKEIDFFLDFCASFRFLLNDSLSHLSKWDPCSLDLFSISQHQELDLVPDSRCLYNDAAESCLRIDIVGIRSPWSEQATYLHVLSLEMWGFWGPTRTKSLRLSMM